MNGNYSGGLNEKWHQWKRAQVAVLVIEAVMQGALMNCNEQLCTQHLDRVPPISVSGMEKVISP